MAFKNEIGNKYGKLTVIKRAENTKDGKTRWVCQCECGKEIIAFGTNLRKGNTKSCGCLRAQHLIKDLIGQKFGRLLVVSRSSNRSKRGVIWKCECECGSIIEVVSPDLTTGNTKSCGCLKADLHSTMNDLSGQRFGKLLALDSPYVKNEQRVWRCMCDCGSEVFVLAGNVRKGNSQSCGCSASHGNNFIKQFLTNKDVCFEKELTFSDCKSPTGALLKFDFGIFINNDLKVLIEYNGIQHYCPVEFFGGEEAFLKQQERDKIKAQYCVNNQYKLEIIKYDENIEERMEEILNGI